MNPSKLLQKFLQSGTKPSTQRDQTSLLDESRSILVSQLPTTGYHIQNFSDGEIDQILAGGKGAMKRAHAIHIAGQQAQPTTSTAARPAAKQDRIAELCAYITQPKKPLSPPVAKTKQTTSDKFNAITITAEGITSHSTRGGRAIKLSKSNQ